MGVTSSTNCNCSAESVATAPCSTSDYADLDTAFTGGQGGTAHTLTVSQTSGASTTYAIICVDTTTSLESGCEEITIDVAGAGGEAPQPSPVSWTPGGNTDVSGTGTVIVTAPL